MAPIEQIRHVADCHERLIAWLARLDPVDPATPSELPGWTVGHVMTHIARNADSFDGMLTAAASGDGPEAVSRRPGSTRRRHRGGRRRPWVELVADVDDACDRLDATLASSDDGVWSFGADQPGLLDEPLTAIPHRRFREVEIHRLDLGLGATWRDWPLEFVDAEWPLSIARLPDRLPDGSAVDLAVTPLRTGPMTSSMFGSDREPSRSSSQGRGPSSWRGSPDAGPSMAHPS